MPTICDSPADLSPAALAARDSRAWVPYLHLLTIDKHLQRLRDGEITRLLVEAPPRHGKSTLISQYLPAWWLGSKPDDHVMLLSYEARHARHWGVKARDTFERSTSLGIKVLKGRDEAGWVRGYRGGMYATSVTSALMGRGPDLLVIDDPVKNFTDSKRERDRVWDSWQSRIKCRLQKDARVVVAMNRWHVDDFAGRLRAQEVDENWTVVRLPSTRIEREERLAGACAPMWDIGRLENRMGEPLFDAMFEQAPIAASREEGI